MADIYLSFSCISEKKLVILQKTRIISYYMKSKVVVYGFAALCILAAVGNNSVITKGESTAYKAGKNNVKSNVYDIEILAQSADNEGEILLTRVGYVTSYNMANKQPNWVGWRLTGDHVTGPYLRKGIKFHEDEDVPEPRATDADYRSSGYDR